VFSSSARSARSPSTNSAPLPPVNGCYERDCRTRSENGLLRATTPSPYRRSNPLHRLPEFSLSCSPRRSSWIR
jgi:hypothetical protein